MKEVANPLAGIGPASSHSVVSLSGVALLGRFYTQLGRQKPYSSYQSFMASYTPRRIYMIINFIVVIITTIFFFSIHNPTASNKGETMTGRDHERSRMEHCVGLFFDPPPPLRWLSDDEHMKNKVDKNLCRDMLRAVGEIRNKWGELPMNYIEALKKVPRFKKNSKALNEFLQQNHPIRGFTYQV
ncbi:unnamed protein product [Ilex paraguariensis]|uniref:Uncharacterized protein n=1 Tax=Ilex paraguariensis TaxID=185542 RepID=A0ABC8SN21_9AQUA